jgi:hypothetical protein
MVMEETPDNLLGARLECRRLHVLRRLLCRAQLARSIQILAFTASGPPKKYLRCRRRADYAEQGQRRRITVEPVQAQEFPMKVVNFRSALYPATRVGLAVLLAAAMTWPSAVYGETRVSARSSDADVTEVELFAAMESGEIEVKVIPKDAKLATVLITNKTDKPLKIALPEALAAVPALAQFGGGGFGGGMGGMGGGMGGMGGMGGGMGGGMQGMGMGMGGMGGGMGGMGGGMGGMGGGGFGGGGFFNVAPEKTGKMKVTAVCLEHGKKDPNPRVDYVLIPIEKFNDDPQVYEICSMLGRGEIDQASAQAAAWHFTDNMSFQELAAKIGIRHLNGVTKPFFAPQQVVRAAHIAQEAARRAQLRSAYENSENSKAQSLSQR